MLLKEQVAGILEDNRETFRRGAERSEQTLDTFRGLLERFARLSPSEVDAHLAHSPWPGARPRESGSSGLIVPFNTSWQSGEEARGWALECLRGRRTFAVDGSQIAAAKEFGVPVGLVQAAWFENPHDGSQEYVKDIRNEIVLPGNDGEDTEEYAFGESKLNQRRFQLEMSVAAQRMARSPSPDLVLIDGSFVLSFAGRMLPNSRKIYLDAVLGLLRASEHHRVPVLGYVDLSYASDLATMLSTIFEVPSENLFDSVLLTDRMKVFDRSAAFQCARGDILPHYQIDDHDYSRDLCFAYLKVGEQRLPARVDFPRWILEAGQLDRMLDILRAEIVVGSGYPYALETADAAAVMTATDRMAFYRLFQDFAHQSGLSSSLPLKSVSKHHRR